MPRIRSLNTIHNRLFVLFLICMLGVVFFLSALYYKRSSDQVQMKVTEVAQKNVTLTADLFDILLQGYDSLSKSLTNNLEIQRLIGIPASNSAVDIINERAIINILGSLFYSRQDLISTNLITNNGKIYSFGGGMNVVNPNYEKSEWYHKLIDSKGEIIWLGIYDHSIIDQQESRKVFAFGRQIYDLIDQKLIGVVLIEAKAEPFLSPLANVRLSPNSEVYVVSQDDRLIATNANSLPDELKIIPWPSDDSGTIIKQFTKQFIVRSRTIANNLVIISKTPTQDLSVELNEIKKYLILILIILVLVSTALANFISKTISSPIKRLIKEMKLVVMGDFSGGVNIKSYEEINILVASFNRMVHRIDQLISRVKLSSISEKNAQLQALQSQVNPHFLYNTLDMIYWMLDEKENDRLGKVVLSLSHMFRYSSKWEVAEVSLKDELMQIGHYLTIIRCRLGERLTTHIEVEDRWLHFGIPKMTLQPIIENAIKYGLEHHDRQGILQIYTIICEKDLNIVVRDNGKGIDPVTLQKLKDSLRTVTQSVNVESSIARKTEHFDAKTTGLGIGLQNVHRRLILMFGENYGIHVESQLGEGTTVTVSVPYTGGGEKVDETFGR